MLFLMKPNHRVFSLTWSADMQFILTERKLLRMKWDHGTGLAPQHRGLDVMQKWTAQS